MLSAGERRRPYPRTGLGIASVFCPLRSSKLPMSSWNSAAWRSMIRFSRFNHELARLAHRLSLTRLIATYRCEIVQKVFSKDQWSMFFLMVDPLKSSKSRPWLGIESPVTHFLTIGHHWITIIYWNEPRGWGIRLRWSTLVLASIPSLASFVQSLSHTWKCSSSFKSTYFW
jgi:hypothetical protein